MIGDDKLLPFRDYDEHEVLNLFALDGLADAGTLVSANTFNPMNGMFTYQAVGYQHAGVTSYRFVNANKVVQATSGAARNDVLGITLYDVKEKDENEIPLVFNRKLAEEKEIVISGETVPVVRRGLFTIKPQAYQGTPGVNTRAIVGSNGRFQFIPSLFALTGMGYTEDNVVAKGISTTGTQFSGHAYILLDLK